MAATAVHGEESSVRSRTMTPTDRARYMRTYRQSHDSMRAKEAAAAAARREALTALAHEHPERFRALLNVARKARGLPPVKRGE